MKFMSIKPNKRTTHALKRQYKKLCIAALEMNEEFKYEGSKNRAIVVWNEYSYQYEILILKVVNR